MEIRHYPSTFYSNESLHFLDKDLEFIVEYTESTHTTSFTFKIDGVRQKIRYYSTKTNIIPNLLNKTNTKFLFDKNYKIVDDELNMYPINEKACNHSMVDYKGFNVEVYKFCEWCGKKEW